MSAADGLWLTVTLTAVFLLYCASALALVRRNTAWWPVLAVIASSLLSSQIARLVALVQEVPQ